MKHDHTDDVFMVATLKQNKTKQANPNPKDVRLGALSYWQRFLVAKFFFFKKRQAKLYPNDSRLKTLSDGPNMANDSHLGALSHWRRVYLLYPN